MKSIKIKNAHFEDAIKVIQQDRNRYGSGRDVPVTTDFEKGYVRGLEGAIFILKEAQRIVEDK